MRATLVASGNALRRPCGGERPSSRSSNSADLSDDFGRLDSRTASGVREARQCSFHGCRCGFASDPRLPTVFNTGPDVDPARVAADPVMAAWPRRQRGDDHERRHVDAKRHGSARPSTTPCHWASEGRSPSKPTKSRHVPPMADTSVTLSSRAQIVMLALCRISIMLAKIPNVFSRPRAATEIGRTTACRIRAHRDHSGVPDSCRGGQYQTSIGWALSRFGAPIVLSQ